MTIAEFQRTKVHSKMIVEYQSKKYDLISVDWEENLVGIDEFNDGDIRWKRCENIKLYDGL